MSRSQTPGRDSRLDEALDWLIELEAADAATRERFDAWLAASPENARAFRRASTLWQSPLLGLAASELERQANTSGQRRPRRRLQRFTAAASVLLALGAALQSDLPTRLRADHVTAVGERQRLELADGSRILLNTDTALSAMVDGQQRNARLFRGEAYFEVAPTRGQPFEVDAGPLRMSLRGTTLVVRYLEDAAEVSVQRGEVDVHTRRDDARFSLSAGDRLRVGPDGVSARDAGQASKPAWVQGRLVFENCTLREVLAELRRYYPGWIVNTDTRLDELSITGNYRLDDPRGAMRSLAQITAAHLHEFPHLMILN